MRDVNRKKEYDLQYIKEKQKRIPVNWLKEDFEHRIAPAIERTGKPVSTFFKEAVEEKLMRDHLLDKIPESSGVLDNPGE